MDLDKRCAPTKNYEEGSCFDISSLKQIALKYNEENKDKIKISDNKKILINQLENKFSKSCSDQRCWLGLDTVKSLNNEEIINNTFRPVGPSKQLDWLSTTHINEVIDQYQAKHSDFLFLGAVPYDFEEVTVLGLNNIDFNKFIKDGKTKIGIVINLDEHDENGSHWVALYADLKKNQIYFFDSVGKKPGKKIKKFITKIVKFLYKQQNNKDLLLQDLLKNKSENNITILQKKLKGFDIRYNHIQHQFKNSECGVYSINFIVRLVKGEKFDDIINTITKDDVMNKCRNTYFRNVNIT